MLLVNVNKEATFGFVMSKKAEYQDNGKKPGAENGKTGKNCYEITTDTFQPVDPMLSLNQYKYFAREHLANNIEISELNGFIVIRYIMSKV